MPQRQEEDETDSYEYIESVNPSVEVGGTPPVISKQAPRKLNRQKLAEPANISAQSSESATTVKPVEPIYSSSATSSTNLLSKQGPVKSLSPITSRKTSSQSSGFIQSIENNQTTIVRTLPKIGTALKNVEKTLPNELTTTGGGCDAVSSSTVNFQVTNTEEDWDNECEYWKLESEGQQHNRVIGT